MPLLPDAPSLCRTCRYWDWRVSFAGLTPATTVDECLSPAEYQAGDDVMECEGYEREKISLESGAGI